MKNKISFRGFLKRQRDTMTTSGPEVAQSDKLLEKQINDCIQIRNKAGHINTSYRHLVTMLPESIKTVLEHKGYTLSPGDYRISWEDIPNGESKDLLDKYHGDTLISDVIQRIKYNNTQLKTELNIHTWILGVSERAKTRLINILISEYDLTVNDEIVSWGD